MSRIYRVLLVEDLEDDIFLFNKALKALPAFKLVGCAQTGDEAIAYLAREEKFADGKRSAWPDIMVLDLKMPARDGFDVLEWLGKQRQRPKVGVFSSSTLPEDRNKAERLGADLFQPKTYDSAEFARFMHWLGKLVDEDRKPKDEFQKALIGGILAEVFARCA